MNSQNILRMVALFICSFLLHGFLPARPALQGSKQNSGTNVELYTDADSYQIYATLLQNEGFSSYAVQAEICCVQIRTDLRIEGDRTFMRSWGAAIDDYAKQNQKPRTLTRSLPLDVPYELLSRSDIHKFELGQEGWDFHKRFPSSYGFYYWFSAVGFNRQRTRAIVNMGYGCLPSSLCGGEQPHFLEKQGPKWQEVKVTATFPILAS
jgi:hypothetical protein